MGYEERIGVLDIWHQRGKGWSFEYSHILVDDIDLFCFGCFQGSAYESRHLYTYIDIDSKFD